ncbi:MAG: LysR family transcriptional regulator [Candidatus Dormibacteraceae bacterium]
MEVEALRTFLTVHQRGTVTAAAPVLFRSQPAVTRRLAQLEREVGSPLFERVPSGLVLTRAGEALLPHAERVLAAVEDTEAALRLQREEDAGPLPVAIVGTLAGAELTRALRELAERHPHVDLRLRTATSSEVTALVRRGTALLGLRYGASPEPGLDFEYLFDERLVVVAAPDHPLAGAPVRGLAALSGERWLAFPFDAARPETAAARVEHLLGAAGVDPTQVLRVDSLTAQKRLVEAGFGIAFLPQSGAADEIAARTLVRLHVRGLDASQPVVLVTRRGSDLGPAGRTLRDGLRALREPE